MISLAVLELLLALPRVSVVVYPQVVLEGHQVRIECRVARDARNRWLEWGLDQGDSSGRQVEGESGPVVFTQLFRADCLSPLKAYCHLTTTDRVWLVTAPLTVVCLQ